MHSALNHQRILEQREAIFKPSLTVGDQPSKRHDRKKNKQNKIFEKRGKKRSRKMDTICTYVTKPLPLKLSTSLRPFRVYSLFKKGKKRIKILKEKKNNILNPGRLTRSKGGTRRPVRLRVRLDSGFERNGVVCKSFESGMPPVDVLESAEFTFGCFVNDFAGWCSGVGLNWFVIMQWQIVSDLFKNLALDLMIWALV